MLGRSGSAVHVEVVQEHEGSHRVAEQEVAQLVLGVTFPDHVSADPNPGMSKITQERIEPQAQQGDSINGEDRGARAAPMGHLSRKVLSPWMQDLVRSFYLSLREKGGPQ